MKKLHLWSLLTVLSLITLACGLFSSPSQPSTGTAPTEPPGNPGTSEPPATGDWSNLSIYEGGLVSEQAERLDEYQGASIYHISYSIGNNPADLSGEQTVHYTNREDVTLVEIQVRLLPNVLGGKMTVSSVMVNGVNVEPVYSLENSLLSIQLNPSLPPGESVDLSFKFSVNIPTEIETNYGILAYYNGVLTLAHTYPMIAVYDDEGWNAEIPPNQGDPTYADASFFRVTVDAPVDLVLVGSGREIGRQENGGRQIVTYAAGPARDFYVAASPEYEKVTKTDGGVTFNAYAPESMKDGAELALNVAIQSFQVFGERYAPYPYTEFDIVSTPTYALGIEYPGVIALAERIYDVEGGSGLNGVLLEATAAHEAGHQWFYNLVGNDQLDEPWLDESLTQFVTWQYFADRYGSSAASGFKESLESRWERVEDPNIPIGLPVAEYTDASYGAIVYGRGAFFFDALREEMGEKKFDAFMQDYTQNHTWGIATSDSLKQVAEQHCNCDLTGLFEEWVYP